MGEERVRLEPSERVPASAPGDRRDRAPHAAGRLLDLQRAAGNRATRAALATPLRRSAPVVRRFTTIPVKRQKRGAWAGTGHPLRVADDGNMAVRDTPGTPKGSSDHQQLYLEPRIFHESLSALIAKGSVLDLELVASDQLEGQAPDGSGHRRLYSVRAQNRYLAGGTTDEVCNAHTSMVMGQMTYNKRYDRGEHHTTRATTSSTRPLVASFDAAVTGSAPSSGKEDVDISGHRDEGLAPAVRAMVGSGGAGAKLSDAEKQAYDRLPTDVRAQAARTLGVNQFASPETGEGYAIYQVAAGMQFHFAPVVARSGQDSVTMENYAGNSGPASSLRENPYWFFRMYGPVKQAGTRAEDDQSFYGQLRAEGDYGAEPLVEHVR